MLMLCDVNEYKRCVSSWKAGAAGKLFEGCFSLFSSYHFRFPGLHALVNLLVVLPENLSDAASSAQLVIFLKCNYTVSCLG